jgi:3-dehydroquinate synthase
MLQNGNILPSATPQIAIIADSHVADLHLHNLSDSIPRSVLTVTFPPGENSKSLPTAMEIYDRLAAAHFERSGVIIAFGGGVAGDLAGFVAATWQRGVRLIQVPTTLLAAVDASVGGKTGVNLTAGKNLVGVFHQPIAVIIDTDFLATLPPRDFRAGLAETVKQAAARAPDFLVWHEEQAEPLAARDADATETLIARNCAIKAEIVALDERESGLRAILNYGHTIGHAIEHLLAYELRHGECVALGMLVENEIAARRGVLARADADRIHALLGRLGLPLHLPRPINTTDVVAACRLDKKVRDQAIHFVLLRAIGMPWQVADVTDAEITAALPIVQP